MKNKNLITVNKSDLRLQLEVALKNMRIRREELVKIEAEDKQDIIDAKRQKLKNSWNPIYKMFGRWMSDEMIYKEIVSWTTSYRFILHWGDRWDYMDEMETEFKKLERVLDWAVGDTFQLTIDLLNDILLWANRGDNRNEQTN